MPHIWLARSTVYLNRQGEVPKARPTGAPLFDMIDGLKIFGALGDVEELKKNPLLDWKLQVHERTGVIESQSAEIAGLRFLIKNKFVRVNGSLHKYANEGLHNHDDFGVDRVANVVEDLWERFGISQNSPLNNIEFGVNVCTPFPPKKFLERLICHKGKPFVEKFENEASYHQCEHEHFCIKIYDKGAMYHLPYNVLRFEIKATKMQFFATKGILLKKLGDLGNDRNYHRLGAVLREYFDEILVDEPTIVADTLKESQRKILDVGRNPKTWVRPKRVNFGGKAEYDRTRTEYDRRLVAFRSLLNNHPKAEGWAGIVSDLIADKWAQLSSVNCSRFTI
ncbi:MAG: hypothetical protein R2822_08840 [Spirosomataceae bacterium]